MPELKTLTKQDILDLHWLQRRNLMNCFPGFKSAVLIGTQAADGTENLAVFNSLIHIGATPPLMGFILRPLTVPRNTFANIEATGHYTINHIHQDMIAAAHLTSAKFDPDVSEFEATGLQATYTEEFPAPYVGESRIRAGLKYKGAIPIPYNDTLLVIGEVQEIHFPGDKMGKDGWLDLAAAETVAISGLDTYLKAEVLDRFDYIRPGESPQSLLNGQDGRKDA